MLIGLMLAGPVGTVSAAEDFSAAQIFPRQFFQQQFSQRQGSQKRNWTLRQRRSPRSVSQEFCLSRSDWVRPDRPQLAFALCIVKIPLFLDHKSRFQQLVQRLLVEDRFFLLGHGSFCHRQSRSHARTRAAKPEDMAILMQLPYQIFTGSTGSTPVRNLRGVEHVRWQQPPERHHKPISFKVLQLRFLPAGSWRRKTSPAWRSYSR